ncbi:MAG: DUF4294 domain-containing protein [Bacteroidales bacterium]|nr:DUF4294 domain-containing protein [Bacteroidales bacterium]
MGKLTTIILPLCLFMAGLLTTTNAAAQEEGGIPIPPSRTGATYMGYRVEKGDTVYYDSINPIWIFPRGRRGKSDLKSYYRLVYNFNKVYPYALLAKDLTMQVDDHIAQNSLRRRKKEKYIGQMQKELFEAYEKPLKSMSISQGRLLIKLIDREIGRSSYKIIKDYKSGITAGFWQGVAKIFGNDLKSAYDPKGDDKMTEYLVEKWRRGEFDALYYSIFWEMPKHPEIKSKTINFED